MSDAAVVHRADTIGDVFAAIAASADRLAVLVDDADRVVAVVTDGDVRRGVLAGRTLEDDVDTIVSRSPLLARADDPDEAVRGLLLAHGLAAIPVIDADGRLTGVRRLADLAPEAARPAVGVLMVGGRGERLRPLTDKMPKPLLRVGGRTIVERLIESFRRAGVEDVYLTLNYMAEEFEERLADGSDLGVRVHYIREREAMDTAGSLSLLEPPTSPLLVSNGDLVTNVDFGAMVDFHRYHRADLTVAGVDYEAEVPYGVLRTASHHLLHIEEKPTLHQLVNAGMYVLEPRVLGYVPGDRPFKMTDLMDALLHDGRTVTVFPLLERWSDIGSKEELERVLYEFTVEEES
jgi:dTDP-glucose pyrophosphorylase